MDALRRHRRPVTAASLADELKVSLRTIYRDVQVLIGLGAPVKLVREAIRRERKLRIAYVAETGAATERAIWPIAMAFYERRQTVAGLVRAARRL